MQLKILIVDDEQSILFAKHEYFMSQGYTLDCARDRQAAEALLTEYTYGVLITDLQLTGNGDAGGLEIAQCARQRQSPRCIILLTAFGTPEIEASAYAHGVNVCLFKPTRMDEIAATMTRLLREVA